MQAPVPIIPPPWKLRGNGFVMLYWFSAQFLHRHGFLREWMHPGYRTGHSLGAVVLADYRETNVGPYQELLFIPGLFLSGWKVAFSITRIYVSTDISVENGNYHWGIPKEPAQFNITSQNEKVVEWAVTTGSEWILQIRLRRMWNGLKLPFTTLPVPFQLQQLHDKTLFMTEPSANGRIQLAKVESLKVNARHFPDVSRMRPWLVCSIPSFLMHFPLAQKLT